MTRKEFLGALGIGALVVLNVEPVVRLFTGGPSHAVVAKGHDFGTAGAPTLSTAATKVDILGFVYNAALTKWCYLGVGLGF